MTYRAAVVHRFREPLTGEQVTQPDVTPGQVRVKVEACAPTCARSSSCTPRGRRA